MKNIWQKFHLNLSTYFFFLFSFFCGYFKQTLLIFFIVFVHECGHIIMIRFCNYKFLKVEFYPFGGITKIDKPINSSLNKEMLIAVAGVLMQGILGLIFYFLEQNKIYLFASYAMFHKYNLTILLFNCLPIIPLDGSIFLHSLIEKFFPFETSFRFYQILSCIFLALFFYVNYQFHMENYFICMVLLTEFFLLKREEKYIIYRFYLERTLGNYPYKKIENERIPDIRALKKETLHFYWRENKYVHEKEILQKKFLKTPEFPLNLRK